MKRFLAIVTCLALTLSLTACGDDSEISISGNNSSGGSVIVAPNSDKIIVEKPVRPNKTDKTDKDEQQEETKPVEEIFPDMDTFTIGDKEFGLRKMTVQNLKDLGFNYSGMWSTSDYMSAKGSVYVNDNGQEIYMAMDNAKKVYAIGVTATEVVEEVEIVDPGTETEAEENQSRSDVSADEEVEEETEPIIETVVTVSTDNSAPLTLYDGIRLGISQEDIAEWMDKHSGTYEDRGEYGLYMAHKDGYSIVVEIRHNVAFKIYVALSKQARLNLTKEELVELIKEEYDGYYKNVVTHITWTGYDNIINSYDDLSGMLLYGQDVNFNALTIDGLQEFGFYPYAISNDYGDGMFIANETMSCIEFKDAGDVSIYVVVSPDGKIEYVYSNTEACGFAGIIPGQTTIGELVDIFGSDIEFNDNGLTILKTEYNTIVISAQDGNVIGVQCTNNTLAGFSVNYF